MRQALAVKEGARRRGQIAMHRSVPAPVGGWNARDSLAAMKPTDAVSLENWFPRTTYCEIRGGWDDHATGMTGTGKTLMVYNAMTGTSAMFATTNSGTYNVSSAGAVGASVLARTNGKHQWTMFGDGTSNWLIAANGVDKIAYYDGTTWTAVDGATTPALTGVTTTDLIQPLVFKGRLMFIQKNSLSFWYLAAGAAGGALSEFDLSGEFRRGGFLMAIGSWSRDAGDGQDDVFVAVSSEGEVVVYQGNNPSAAASWAKIGTFFVGKPIGRRCLCQFGGDLIIITENGVFPMSAALQSVNIDYRLALSNKIENSFTDAARSFGAVFGWEATVFPAYSALIVNVPTAEDGEHEQYVMNTITKAWCKFKEWDAETFTIFNKELYFAIGTTVRKAWTGQADGVDDIIAYGKQAFNYFGSHTQQKRFVLYRPVLQSNGPLAFLTDIDVDFQEGVIQGIAIYSSFVGAQWDVSLWDDALWASGQIIQKQWTSPNCDVGYCGAGKLQIATNALSVQWVASDFVYESGGIL